MLHWQHPQPGAKWGMSSRLLHMVRLHPHPPPGQQAPLPAGQEGSASVAGALTTPDHVLYFVLQDNPGPHEQRLRMLLTRHLGLR